MLLNLHIEGCSLLNIQRDENGYKIEFTANNGNPYTIYCPNLKNIQGKVQELIEMPLMEGYF